MEKKVLYQLSTHWDREWYKPFQGFRYFLVEMMDSLIEALQNDTIPPFTFDGQSVVLEDYLEVRPDKRGALEDLIRQGKLKVGPWYVMPDELLVSGESLVENFLAGAKAVRAFGGDTWKFGYINDIFGHVAQFPQILNGFDIDGVYLGRGASDLPEGTAFVWNAPDGSRCLAYKHNYANFKRNYEKVEDRDACFENVDKVPSPVVLLNYTDDHAVVGEDTVDFVKRITARGGEEGFEKFSQYLAPYIDSLPQKTGELIRTAQIPTDFRAVTHSISSYYPLKRANDHCEHQLYEHAAPLEVMAEKLGLFEKRAFLDVARRYLLKNQPHDSICGCSVDAVHRDMPYRYSQVNTICEVMEEDFLTKLKSKVTAEAENYSLLLFNTDVHKTDGVFVTNIDLPTSYRPLYSDNAGYQQIQLFALQDENGREVPYQILSIERGHELYSRQETIKVNRYTVALKTTLNPFGVTRLTIHPTKALQPQPLCRPAATTQAENEYLHLSVDADGTLTITDKVTGRVYAGLHTFADDADGGNGWFYESAGYDAPLVSSVGGTVSVAVIHRGDLLTTFRVTKTVMIPTELDYTARRRSDDYSPLTIVSDITLKAGSRRVEFTTVIDNRQRSHRVRMLLPSGIAGSHYITSQAYTLIERKRELTEELAYREPECYEKSTGGLLGVQDGTDALYFVGKEGFHEAGVYPDGTVSVTLFRAMGRNFHEPHAEEAQLQGKLTFTYAVAVGETAETLGAYKTTMCEEVLSLLVAGDGMKSQSFVSLDSDRLVMSTLKPAETANGYILRLFNPTTEAIDATLTFPQEVSGCQTTLAEQPLADTAFTGTALPLSVPANKIITLYLEK